MKLGFRNRLALSVYEGYASHTLTKLTEPQDKRWGNGPVVEGGGMLRHKSQLHIPMRTQVKAQIGIDTAL